MLLELHLSFLDMITEFEIAHNLKLYEISFNVQKFGLFYCPLTSFALATALGKLLFSKQKLSQSASMQLQIAMNIFYSII